MTKCEDCATRKYCETYRKCWLRHHAEINKLEGAVLGKIRIKEHAYQQLRKQLGCAENELPLRYEGVPIVIDEDMLADLQLEYVVWKKKRTCGVPVGEEGAIRTNCFFCNKEVTRTCDWCEAPLCEEHMTNHTTDDCETYNEHIRRSHINCRCTLVSIQRDDDNV